MKQLTAQGLLKKEQASMGRDCHLVDSAKLKGGVTVIVYDVEAFEDGQVQRRAALAVGIQMKAGIIVKIS